MNNRKIAVVLIACVACGAAFARPGFGGHGWHHGPIVHHHHGGWGRGGCNFWPGFVGGLVGGAIVNSVVSTPVVASPTIVTTPTIVTAPAVVTQPVVVQQPVVTAPVVTQPVVVQQPVVQQPATTVQNVWVEGRYVDQQQADGTVVRTWQPGHYEQRTVVVQ